MYGDPEDVFVVPSKDSTYGVLLDTQNTASTYLSVLVTDRLFNKVSNTMRASELAKYMVIPVKEPSDNIEQISDVIQRSPEEFLVLSGCDHLNFISLCLGGHGVISTVANLVPEKVKAMVNAVHDNEFRTA